MKNAQTANIGVIFDCDGTLVDSVDGWRRTEHALAQMAGAELSPEDIAILCASTLPETGAFYHEKFGLGSCSEDVVRMVDEILIDYYRNEASLRPGALAFVEGLAQLGIPMSIASSSPRRYLKACFESVGLAELVPLYFSAEDVGASKREPRLYRHCASQMGTIPALTWGFEDTLYAVRTLVDGGFKCVGCYDRDESASLADLQVTATFAIASFEEITAAEFVERAMHVHAQAGEL